MAIKTTLKAPLAGYDPPVERSKPWVMHTPHACLAMERSRCDESRGIVTALSATTRHRGSSGMTPMTALKLVLVDILGVNEGVDICPCPFRIVGGGPKLSRVQLPILLALLMRGPMQPHRGSVMQGAYCNPRFPAMVLVCGQQRQQRRTRGSASHGSGGWSNGNTALGTRSADSGSTAV